MLNTTRSILATALLLFAAQAAQAATMPTISDPNKFGIIGQGSYTKNDDLPDSDPNIVWFSFNLDDTYKVDLDTFGSSPNPAADVKFTILALYDDGGTLLGQNDDCVPGSVFRSCLSFSSLATGMYIAGIMEYYDSSFPFVDGWMLGPDNETGAGSNNVFLNINVSPVPVPAAVWLFGSALLGFVGMSRRTSIKT